MVSPSVMSWARRRRGVAVEELANRLNVKPDADYNYPYSNSARESGQVTCQQAERQA